MLRPGDVVVTLGVGEPWRAARAIVDGLPRVSVERVEEGVALSRLTTIGTGGAARAFARLTTLGELEEAVGWAAERELEVVTVGLGSNVLAADDGVDALVVRLEGELASVEVEGELLRAGGGASNAVCLHRARAAGLGGLEFACAIPGTAGGGVRMNAGAYGSRLGRDSHARARRLGRRQRLADDGRARPLVPALRTCGRARSSLGSSTGSCPRPVEEIKAQVAELVAQRKATQPTNKRTFGSVFKNPPGELGAGRHARALRPQGSSDRRRDHLADATRTSSRTRAARRPPTASR